MANLKRIERGCSRVVSTVEPEQESETMRAVVFEEVGEKMEVEEVERPEPDQADRKSVV